MNKEDLPRGTVITLGHPANRLLAVKGTHGWRWVDSGRPIDYDDLHKLNWDIVSTPKETS